MDDAPGASLRHRVRDAAARVLYASGLTRARRLDGRLAIVTFHRVLRESQRRAYPLPHLAVTPDELRWFLAYFRRHFACGTLTESLERWERRREGRPLLAITFDDATADNFENARPMLEELGLRATFYVPVTAVECQEPLWHDRFAYAVDRLRREAPEAASELLRRLGLNGSARSVRPALVRAKRATPSRRAQWVREAEQLAGPPTLPHWTGVMSWAQLRTLVEAGHELGCHSMTHEILPQLDDDALEAEVGDARRALEARFPGAVHSFAYPDGSFDRRVLEAVRRAGFGSAVTTRWGTNRVGEPLHQLRRCEMVPAHVVSFAGGLSHELLAWRLSDWFPGPR
jgi:peptidoglycan/xylan/chitin deacetylase (PgdA/CDA1 family)